MKTFDPWHTIINVSVFDVSVCLVVYYIAKWWCRDPKGDKKMKTKYLFKCCRDTKSGIHRYFDSLEDAVKFYEKQMSENMVGYWYFSLWIMKSNGDKQLIYSHEIDK